MGLLNIIKDIFSYGRSEPVNVTLRNPKRRLKEDQFKTIALVRDLAKKQSNKQMRMLEVYKEYIAERQKDPPGTPPQRDLQKPIKTINASLPGTMTQEVQAFLKELNAIKLSFPQGLIDNGKIMYVNASGDENSLGTIIVQKEIGEAAGIHIRKNDALVEMVVNNPLMPSEIQSPMQMNQGELIYRMKVARAMEHEEAANDGTDDSRKRSSGRKDDSADDVSSDSPSEGFSVLSDIQLDNVAWHDFTLTQYVFDPEYLQFNQSSSSYITPAILDTAKDVHLAGGDASVYISFAQKLSDSVANGIINAFIGYGGLSAWEPETNSLLYASVSAGGEQGRLQLPRIVTRIMDALSPAIYADIAESYYAIDYLSLAESYWAQESLLRDVKKYFEHITDHYWYSVLYYRDVHGWGNILVPEAELLTHWVKLRDALIDEYGVGLLPSEPSDEFAYASEPVPSEYSFDPYLPGSYNFGLRLVYRQEWRALGNQRGEIIRTVPLGPKQVEKISTKIVRRTKVTKTSESLKSTETTTETSDTSKDSTEIVEEATSSSSWNINQEVEGGYNAGMWKVEGKTSGGYSNDSSDSSKKMSNRLSEMVQKTASKMKTESKVVVSTESETTYEATTASEIHNPNEEIAITYVYSKLQRQYEIFTSLAEVQNVIMVAEKIPAPEEIDFSWIKKHDWIIAKVLLDDSFRDALNSISQEVKTPDQTGLMGDIKSVMNSTVGHLGKLANNDSHIAVSGVDMVQESQRGYREAAKERTERQRQNYMLEAKKHRLYEHIRENILHYCRAIWSVEDPQQRLERYKRLNITIPKNWIFAPETGDPWIVEDLLAQIQDSGTFEIEGRFEPAGTDVLLLADMINPLGPLGFYSNYAMYYVRSEHASENIFNVFNIIKTPYLYYDSEDVENRGPVLMDPLLQELTREHKGEGPSDREEKKEMIQYVPELRLRYAMAERKGADAIEDLFNNEELFKKYFPEFLFRKEKSRRFLHETNNVLIDILPGDGSALEPFKLDHRHIDVLKAMEEKKKMELENERRRKLLAIDKLGDPDIEKITIVTDNNDQISSIVAGVDAGSSDPDSGGD